MRDTDESSSSVLGPTGSKRSRIYRTSLYSDSTPTRPDRVPKSPYLRRQGPGDSVSLESQPPSPSAPPSIVPFAAGVPAGGLLPTPPSSTSTASALSTPIPGFGSPVEQEAEVAASTATTSTPPLSSPPMNATEAAGSQTPTQTTGSSSVVLFPTNVSISHSSSSRSSTSTVSRPWTYQPSPSKTTSGTEPSKTTFVPGVVFNLTLGGDSDTEAVYSVPMTFGHGTSFKRQVQRRGSDYETLNMQVDLGSSDMWAAVKSCKTADCKAQSGHLFDNSNSLPPDLPQYVSLSYESGSVSGQIMWEQVTLGSFGIAYQAFLAADKVYNEDLSGGDFSGLLGLALPANSLIEDAIPGTTGSNPDGATFLDNLFGAGPSAPSQRLFSLSLARREDTRTVSSLALGAVDERVCPSPCVSNYIPIIPHANMGKTGYLHWRVPISGAVATKFSNAAAGTGASRQTIKLSPSVTDTKQPAPLAILDSGGVAILVADKSYADALYGAYGITADSDGYYRLPCNQPLSFSFIIGGDEFPVHPLDMSWPDPNDQSMTTCIGAIQVSSSLGSRGDFVLGSTFMKNVYSVFQYPDQKGSNWQPTVGMKSLTEASQAAKDFYAVRTERKSLTTVSSTGSGSNNPSSNNTGASNAAQGRVVNTAIIAACSVVGFFVLAALAFCAWWFWLRRRVAKGGVVEYKMAPQTNHKTEGSMSTFRSRKHEDTQRQKSMVEGFSDYDVDSWRSTTEGGDSIRLANLPEEVGEEDDRVHQATRLQRTNSSHTRGSSLHQSLLNTEGTELIDFYPIERRSSWEPRMDRRLSGSEVQRPTLDRRLSDGAALLATPSPVARLIDLPNSPPTSPPANTYSHLPASSPRKSSMSMSGPFPTPNRLTRSTELDEYFPILPGSTPTETPAERARRASRSSSAGRISRYN